jgi:hypothetical protein
VGHIVGAYGMFWERGLVEWFPGKGPMAWQLLGKRNKRPPALRMCDFRQAHGVYVLYDDYGARYAGLARGRGGVGARLRTHDDKPPRGINWSRFSWFSFDDVIQDPGRKDGWDAVKHREKPVPADPEAVIREVEALTITLLGTTQNDMKFQAASKWEQLPYFEAQKLRDSGAVDPRGFTFRPWES